MSAHAEGSERVHLLVPGAAGGGWDTTARGVGAALREAGLADVVSFENMSGASGARAVTSLVEGAAQKRHVLMVSSTPIVVRSLMPVFQQNWRDLTPIAAVVGDYGIVAVRSDSPFTTLEGLLNAFREDPRRLKIAGGSNRGGMDHLIAGLMLQAAGLDPRAARYVPYDAGGRALLALLGGETPVMTATLGDALTTVRAGRVRLLALAAPERSPDVPDVPTFRELGYDVAFVNWRGFFGPPGLPADLRDRHAQMLLALEPTAAWERVRARHGWVNNFIGGEAFAEYLVEQEAQTATLMRRLGFLESSSAAGRL
ncbi:MAG: tripartite tricarboxylate transporter substrate-binding protein [Pseudomonadota bacterium]